MRLARPTSARRWRHASTGDTSGGAGTSTLPRDSLPDVSASGESDANVSSPSSPPKAPEKETKDMVALRSLDAYFEKLKGPEEKEKEKQEALQAQAAAAATSAAEKTGPAAAGGSTQAATPAGVEAKEPTPQQDKDAEEELKQLLKQLLETKPGESTDGLKKDGSQFQITTFGGPSQYQQWLDAQLLLNPSPAVNIILAINVAVFLFELASPEAVPGLIVTSLPSLLGAKVNTLIAAGEWWRLITPMFLHAGFFHVLLGSLVLLSLGPGVEVAFGSVGFLAAYLVGGVYGNLMSYWQTADVTVGGTGPIYGIVAAYLVYLWRNRQAIGKEEAESSMWSLVFFASLNVAIGSALPIDDWTHIGAALGGLLFASLASPTVKRGPVGYSKLTQVLKSAMEKDAGKEAFDPLSAGSTSSSKEEGVEPRGTLFLLERLGPTRSAWALAACLGIAAVLLDLSSAGIPDSLLDISNQITL